MVWLGEVNANLRAGSFEWMSTITARWSAMISFQTRPSGASRVGGVTVTSLSSTIVLMCG